MGFGIGLIVGRLVPDRYPQLALCDMSRHFGRTEVSFIWRKGATERPQARAFADIAKTVLKRR